MEGRGAVKRRGGETRLGAPVTGCLRGGLPYNRVGRGPRPLVVFQGLMLENKPAGGLSAHFMLGPYKALADEFTTYLVTRRSGLPHGCTLADMADEYAAMIKEELEPPIDVIGTSTGGSIALQFAADHPELVRRLVVHSAAYTLGPRGRQVQRRAGELAAQGRWGPVAALLMEWVMPRRGWKRRLLRPFGCLAGLAMALSAPKDASDFVVTIQAEDTFDLRDRLGEITAPTLVIAGAEDPGYSPQLFRQTAAGISGARLVLYEGMGHPASGPRFRRDLRAFLLEDDGSARDDDPLLSAGTPTGAAPGNADGGSPRGPDGAE